MVEPPYCPRCGAANGEARIGGRMRAVCSACGTVHWRNPKVGVAVVLRDAGGRVLLVRRRSPEGTWCIPCGNVEWDEEVHEAARRECLEETGLHVEVGGVHAVLSNTHDPEAHSVGIWFRARVTGGTERAGGDALDVGWFSPDRPPRLAFPTDARVLRDLARNQLEAGEPDAPRAVRGKESDPRGTDPAGGK